MTRLGSGTAVGVLGAGAMGAGIAQVALRHGHDVLLADARPDAAPHAAERIAQALAREVEKGRMVQAEANVAVRRLTALRGVEDLSPFARCGLVIEAVVEDLAVKRDVFRRLEREVPDDAVLATNTSSLSVASLAGACRVPGRVLGVHFFNPAPVMPLVEIVPALGTDRRWPTPRARSSTRGARRRCSPPTRRGSSSTAWRARSTASRCDCSMRGSPTRRRSTGRCATWRASAWDRSS
jgi:NAD(P)-dependent dehydrogenase (short-subunit alcohol dehydrogenase family)